MAITLVNLGTAVGSGDGDALRLAFSEVNGSLTDLDTRLSSATSTIALLGGAARLNVGTITGSVADGGLLTAEIARATAAEQANTTLINNEVSRAQGVEALKAAILSPAFTGTPTAPTAANGTNTNQIATCAFVLSNGGTGGGGGGTGGVPATRLINTTGLATGGGDLTTDRTISVPAASQADVAAGTDQTKALTPYSVAARLGALAPLASPTFVGTPTAPTATTGSNTAQIATTAFVAATFGTFQRTAYRFVATAGQTTFSGTDAAGLTLAYTAGFAVPFVNGRRLSPPDFTATDGTSVVIASGLNAGDEVLIIADAAYTVANTYTQAQTNATFAPLASPTFTGTPAVPTAAAGTNTTQAASTAFVAAAFAQRTAFFARLASDAGVGNGVNLLTLTPAALNRGSAWNGSRFTAPAAGVYTFSGQVQLSGGTANTGAAGALIRVNGSDYIVGFTDKATNFLACPVSATIVLAANDYVELYANLSGLSGTVTAQNFRTFFSGFFVG